MSTGLESLGDWRRTDLCGTLRPADVGREVTLCGWVHARRDHGGVLFLDLRDRSGLVQAVCNPTESAAAHARAGELRLEYVVAARGAVRLRPEERRGRHVRAAERQRARGDQGHHAAVAKWLSM